MQRTVHNLVQGSPEWHKFRLDHDGASETAAMLGVSKNVTRTELLAAKATGIAKEFSDFIQKRVLDKGHEVEALARPIAEALIGEELFPATMSLGPLSASCDGLTMDGTTAFEHKQWEEALAAAVARGEVPEEHFPQCQQVMLVTGAEKLLFMVSNGTPEKCVHCWVTPHQGAIEDITAGWKQFDQDVKNFKHVEVLPPPTAEVKLGLPALSIVVNGKISLIDNLAIFGAKLTEFIDAVDRNPSTDQAFADTEAAIKTLEKAQVALEAAESNALAQTASIDEMRRTVEQYVTLARTTRLALEKVVKARKETIRIEIVTKGKADFAAHVAELNKQITRPYMPEIPTDFGGVIKGMKSVKSLQNAVDTELARAKIAANEVAGKIQINMAALREHATEYVQLFPDTAQIVLKAPDDMLTLVKLRINEHKQAEQKKLDEQRERIRQEEAAKLQKEADERAAAEAKAAQDKIDQANREAQAKIEQQETEARLKREADDRAAQEARDKQAQLDRLAREAQQRKDDEAAALARAEQRKKDELLGVRELMVTLCDRCGDKKEFAGVVKAINTYFAKHGDPRRGEDHREAA